MRSARVGRGEEACASASSRNMSARFGGRRSGGRSRRGEDDLHTSFRDAEPDSFDVDEDEEKTLPPIVMSQLAAQFFLMTLR